MGTEWSTTPDFTFTEQDLWFSKIASADSTVDFKHVAEAPEDFDILPSDVDVIPEVVQSDNEDWTMVSAGGVVPSDNTTAGWSTVYTGVREDEND